MINEGQSVVKCAQKPSASNAARRIIEPAERPVSPLIIASLVPSGDCKPKQA